MHLTTLLDHEFIAVEKEHELNLLVKLQAPKAHQQERRPLNLVVVLDRSGSMGGEKLAYTKEAVKLLVKHLTADDLISVVTFESDVETLLEPTAVDNKSKIYSLIDGIDVDGCTNLSGGWLKGIELARQNADGKRLNRVLILTDGLANEGITDEDRLASLGMSAYEKHNIVTTTLGFGADFDEDLLSSIATKAGGKFYYIDTPDAAPAVFQEELEGLLSLVAQNIEVSVTMKNPVKLMKQWTGYTSKVDGATVTFNLGDAYCSEEKRVLLSLLVPNMKKLGQRTVADVRLKYTEITTKTAKTYELVFPVIANITDEKTAKASDLRTEVIEELGLQMAAEARRKAIEKADRGDFDGVRFMLDDTVRYMQDLPVADSGKIREEIAELSREAEDLACAASYSPDARKRSASSAYNLATSQHAKLVRERKRRNRRND